VDHTSGFNLSISDLINYDKFTCFMKATEVVLSLCNVGHRREKMKLKFI